MDDGVNSRTRRSRGVLSSIRLAAISLLLAANLRPATGLTVIEVAETGLRVGLDVVEFVRYNIFCDQYINITGSIEKLFLPQLPSSYCPGWYFFTLKFGEVGFDPLGPLTKIPFLRTCDPGYVDVLYQMYIICSSV
jgi:hypothetical protein